MLSGGGAYAGGGGYPGGGGAAGAGGSALFIAGAEAVWYCEAIGFGLFDSMNISRSVPGSPTKRRLVFRGTSTGWDVSFLRGEFTHGNDESMLVMRDENSQNFYFFFGGKLWKWYKAFDAEVFAAGDFANRPGQGLEERVSEKISDGESDS